MSVPAHLARPSKTRKKKKINTLPVGTEMNHRRILSLESEGKDKSTSRYRVKNLVCGHESVVTHKRFIERRNQHGMCQACARAKAVEDSKKKWKEEETRRTGGTIDPDAGYLDRQRAKEEQKLREFLSFHNIWYRSLGI